MGLLTYETMKKTYIKPATLDEVPNVKIMSQITASSTNDGHGSVDPIEKDNREEGGWAGAKENKGYDAWNTWDDEE